MVDALVPPANALAPANVHPERTGMPQHPEKIVTLGAMDPNSGFFLNVELSTRGAAIQSIEMNDPRFPEYGNRKAPLKIVGSDPGIPLRTFATAIPQLDAQLAPRDNLRENWEVVPESQTESTVEFRMLSPDGDLEVTKRYELKRLTPEELKTPRVRDLDFRGYELFLTVKLRNLSGSEQIVDYTLQGPVSLPLEDPENSSKFRDIRMAFLENGGVKKGQMSAAEVVDKENADKKEHKQDQWKKPIKYIGVDVKYFAALIQPQGDQLKSPTVKSAEAQLVEAARDKKHSDISVLLNSTATLEPKSAENDTVEHEYLLFAGPKRQDLLAGVGAESIVDFGYVNVIARAMLWLLNTFHRMGASYGVAIILLTVLVRGAMFPVSRHQAKNMQRMKEFQPKIKELQAKYKDKKEELAKAQMELFRKHGYNPLAGCLPLLLQLPIFIGLYTALSSSVDMRMQRFLWIDNLASPDALFHFGFKLPFLGWDTFNLLPILSTGLMFFQQKMMMPPPADEEQAMQMKMMNFMMIFMGAMFYRVPAGLCVYFIASSLWGMTERFLLNKLTPKTEPGAVATEALAKSMITDEATKTPGRFGELWNKLQAVADKDVSITRTNGTTTPNRNGKKKKR
ncbi:MAG: YidC/Oxa1 family insertase periplasmic-domain containing protein [Planctomycetaceae bacterium]